MGKVGEYAVGFILMLVAVMVGLWIARMIGII
jgi:hypothetical protein